MLFKLTSMCATWGAGMVLPAAAALATKKSCTDIHLHGGHGNGLRSVWGTVEHARTHARTLGIKHTLGLERCSRTMCFAVFRPQRGRGPRHQLHLLGRGEHHRRRGRTAVRVHWVRVRASDGGVGMGLYQPWPCAVRKRAVPCEVHHRARHELCGAPRARGLLPWRRCCPGGAGIVYGHARAKGRPARPGAEFQRRCTMACTRVAGMLIGSHDRHGCLCHSGSHSFACRAQSVDVWW